MLFMQADFLKFSMYPEGEGHIFNKSFRHFSNAIDNYSFLVNLKKVRAKLVIQHTP